MIDASGIEHMRPSGDEPHSQVKQAASEGTRTKMIKNHHIVDAELLRKLSGKRTEAAVRRWASRQGIPIKDGAHGPWTTIQAVNASLGVSGASNDVAYSPDIL